MLAMRKHAVVFVMALAIPIISCSSQTEIIPRTPTTTLTPVVIVVIVTPLPSPKPLITPDKLATQGWETPPSEILLGYDPTRVRVLPPPSRFTEIVADRKFQFTNPPDFKFRDSSLRSVMENKDKSIMVYLEVFEHHGKANALGFLGIMLDGKMYKATSTPIPHKLSGYQGWIVDIESPAIYDHGIGKIIIVDIDASNLFYAIGIAKPAIWEAEGKQIYADVVDSLTFPGFK